MTEFTNRWFVISFGNEEFPIAFSTGSEFSPENVFLGKVTILYDTAQYLVERVLIQDDKEVLFIFLIFSSNVFIDGYITKNGQQYNIEKYARYKSLQVGNNAYDNICVIQSRQV